MNKQNKGVVGGSGSSAALVSDIGIVKKGSKSTQGGASTNNSAGGKSTAGSTADGLNNSQGHLMEDSFEKYYNKDLDLEED